MTLLNILIIALFAFAHLNEKLSEKPNDTVLRGKEMFDSFEKFIEDFEYAKNLKISNRVFYEIAPISFRILDCVIIKERTRNGIEFFLINKGIFNFLFKKEEPSFYLDEEKTKATLAQSLDMTATEALEIVNILKNHLPPCDKDKKNSFYKQINELLFKI